MAIAQAHTLHEHDELILIQIVCENPKSTFVKFRFNFKKPQEQ